jgi:hypothetical protein
MNAALFLYNIIREIAKQKDFFQLSTTQQAFCIIHCSSNREPLIGITKSVQARWFTCQQLVQLRK